MPQSFLGANSPHGNAHTQNLFLPAGAQDNAARPPKRQRTTPTQAAANSFMAASNQAGNPVNNASAASQQQQKYTNNQQNQYRGGTSNNAGVGGQGHSQQQQQQQHQHQQQHQQQQDPGAATVPNHPAGAVSKYMSPTIPHAALQHHTSIPPPPRPLQQPSSNLTHHIATVDPRIKSETAADVDDIIAALRVREEGSNETFAVPIGIIDGWESMMTALQKCFNRSGDIKLMNSRGDTISRFMLSHFLKDGTLLIVSFGPPTARPAPPPPKPTSPPKPPVPTAAATTLAIPPPHHPPQQQQQQQQQQQSYTPLPAAAAPTPPAATPQQPAPPAPPPYKLSRSITTVAELWEEWENGLSPNQPSVKFLEEKYGPKWRTSQAERKFFSRRKVVVDEVRKLMEQGSGAWEAVAVVERWRDARSLDALSKLIVERRKSGGAVGGAVGGGSAKGEKKDSAHMVNEWS